MTVFLRMLEQMFGDGKAVGEHLHPREASGCTIWNVVVPPLMMIASPSSQRSTAAAAMARFSAMFGCLRSPNGRPDPDELRRRVIASAPPRTRRSRFCTCSGAMSRRIVASDGPGQRDQIGHRDHGPVLNGRQNDPVAFFRAWTSSLNPLRFPRSPVTVNHFIKFSHSAVQHD
jgi:hypothetical protein